MARAGILIGRADGPEAGRASPHDHEKSPQEGRDGETELAMKLHLPPSYSNTPIF
ncbi:hypothetical protein DSL72_009528 [Monilinia vaccinii-corymbosi]|uniref:Uncharacterized protein n=1 Tax=Monilinia vaccinii-corymbosi TaxID=61207 RepID=A0A8A3PQK9_9HELO|nr:hypothetical protein DSL72_009528 [Monilinia vaccinii-corymbosi]